jgi:PhnB protein
MSAQVKPIPEQFHTVTPGISISGAADAIAFYEKAFGAEELYRFNMPDGRVAHAEIKIGDSIVMISDDCGMEDAARSPANLGGSSASLLIYTTDTDAAFKRAVDAGAKVASEPTDMFWGDRFARVIDPYGHHWAIATHTEDVTEEEMTRRMVAEFGG